MYYTCTDYYSRNGMYYAHKDHLGSYDVIVDEDKNRVDSLHFDAWGNRKQYANWTQNDTRLNRLFDRGFTSHEHLDNFKIINMKVPNKRGQSQACLLCRAGGTWAKPTYGRLYDPVIARFFSPDPYVQFPGFTQNYNRYSYCLNNPLMYTDPSGEFLWGIMAFIIRGGFDLLTGNWQGWEGSGKPALMAGLGGLFTPVGSSVGGMDLLKFSVSEIGNRIIGNHASVNVQVGDFSFSISPGLGYSSGSGLSWGVNGSAAYNSDNWNAAVGVGVGSNYLAAGGYASYKGSGAGYYATFYGSKIGPDGKPNKQIVGGVTAFGKDFSLRFENDFLAKNGDRWRTNAFEVQYKNFVFGTSVYTNAPDISEKADFDGRDLLGNLNKNGNGAWKDGQVYLAPMWFGYKNESNVIRIGYSHPMVQDRTQNWVHRNGFLYLPFGYQNFYNRYDDFYTGPCTYSGYYNPFSLY
ncbi:hypothetical protein LJC68_02075 [Bacteroidales bacterium OttesenSCG-928-B11]|nr:hypothetical protein [Bacteroidales bacterium OttesenSCG-928-C03]MDL2311648.1 hypothetical protein [Bacteroidales bacterium OttesenSCG-928-B11]